MNIHKIVNSIFNSITYILPISNEKDYLLIDCGDVDQIIKNDLNIKFVLLTHSHFDHIYGLNKLVEIFPNVLVYTNIDGKKGLLNPRWNFSHYHYGHEDFIFHKPENIQVIEKESLYKFGNLETHVLFTPGHEPSCLSYIIDNNLYTGDAYIPGVKTVMTFPRSNKLQAVESLKRLQNLEKMYKYNICPGHPAYSKQL